MSQSGYVVEVRFKDQGVRDEPAIYQVVPSIEEAVVLVHESCLGSRVVGSVRVQRIIGTL